MTINHYFNCELSYKLKGVVEVTFCETFSFFTKSYDAVDKKAVSSCTKELGS